jgi:pyruvate carboxylase subunit A
MKAKDGSLMTFVTGDVHAHPDEVIKKPVPPAPS